MKISVLLLLSTAPGALCGFTTQDATPIEIIGKKFFNSSSGEQFYMKGVAYQRARKEGDVYDGEAEPGYIDSLASPGKCLRDLEYLKELGVNTVRVYQIDPTQSHDVCMDALANHGIYVLADLSEPNLSINRLAPFWDIALLDRYKAVVDCMQKYSNMLGFIAGNEVVNTVGTSDAAAFVKASVRDIKRYIREKNYRHIPVGYASTDESVTRVAAAHYFTCDSAETSVDFYGINMFEWCGFSSYETSGYKDRTQEFGRLDVPVFFSEYGCNTDQPRPFTEIDSLYGPTMAQVWSGGVVYELFQNDNNYGLVEEKPHGKIVKLNDFNIVKLRLLEAAPVGTSKADSAETLPPVDCPEVSDIWHSSRLLPPTPDDGKCECLQATLSCVITPYLHIDESRLIQDVCTKVDCSEISADGMKGVYGNFSDCSVRQRASYALTKYWKANQEKPELCDFDRRAILVTPEENIGSLSVPDGRTCKAVLGMEPEPVPTLDGQEHIEKSDSLRNEDSGKMTVKSAAQKPGHLGFVMFLVTVASVIYLAT